VRSRRNTELGLLLFGSLITAGLYALASLGREASIPANIGPFLAVVIALPLVAHLAVRRLAPEADPLLLPIAALLNGIGYVFIVRLALKPSERDLAGLQANWTLLGIGAFIGTLYLVRRTRDLDRYRYTFALVGVGLLMMPLLPVVGRAYNGSRIWAKVGPVSLQPGEFAKVALVVFFASYLVEKRELLRMATFEIGPLSLPEPKHAGPVLAAWAVSLVVLIYQKDLGTSLLFFAVFVTMVWIATERNAYLVFGGLLFLAGAFISYRQFGHVRVRVQNWLDPWRDFAGKGYQTIQGQFALAAGGITGAGPGLGRPELIPEVRTDFIFAAIGEELGLLGATALVVSYLLMVGSGLRIALAASVPFEKLLAAGLAAMLGIQAFIIIGGVLRVLPLTGITLPFVSYGGSSLLTNYILLALLLRISDESAARRHSVEAEAVTAA
jgi:peptidoglycan glycosyltransferase